ncbi:hypothetical protein VTN02DRAFT_179 [Thermoascus thermophilus]
MLGNSRAQKSQAHDASRSTCRMPSSNSIPSAKHKMVHGYSNRINVNRASSSSDSSDTVGYSTSPLRGDCEESPIEEEAELLLSQFMKRSCRGAHQPSSETAVHDHTYFHRPPKRTASGDIKPVEDSQAESVYSDESGVGFSAQRTPAGDAGALAPQRQHGYDTIHTMSTNTWHHPNAAGTESWRKRPSQRGHLPSSHSLSDGMCLDAASDPVNIALPARRESPEHIMSQLRGPQDSHLHPVSTQSDLLLKKRGRKPRSERNDKPTGLASQRLRRSNAAPINYYVKYKFPNIESESDEETIETRYHETSHPEGSVSASSPVKFGSLIGHSSQSRILYSSAEVQIHQRPFQSLNEFPDLIHACYASRHTPAAYAKRATMHTGNQLLHFDFDQEEMSAVLGLLSYYGLQPSSSEMSLSDQVIEAVSSSSGLDPPTFLARQMSLMRDLYRLFTDNGVKDIEAFLLAAARSDMQISLRPQLIKHMARLIKQLLGSQHAKDGALHIHLIRALEVDPDKIRQLSRCLPLTSALKRRECADIEAFLLDAKRGSLPTTPRLIQSLVPDTANMTCTYKSSSNISTLLRIRELGSGVNRRIQKIASGGLKLSKSWKGASNDVIVLTWSPDGTRFAVGAAAQCDEHNMQYNRGNNLILGDLVTNSLKELPDHWIPRPLPATRNTDAAYITEPRLYMSVSAVQWCENMLFTASYDNTVKLWDVSSHSGAACIKTLRHESKVQVMARSNFDRNLLATGTQSIGLWNIGEDDPTYAPLAIIRPRLSKNMDLVPSSLSWGSTHSSRNILAAGMSGKDPENGDISRDGHLAVWRVDEASITPVQVTPNSQNIFDIKWHPTLPVFATASSCPQQIRTTGTARDTRSVVRVYEPLASKRTTIEFDCPALDINDVTFCPMDTNYISASCTDGITYVWDYRKPSEILHKLQHGGPLNQLDENLTREQADVGVRAALWGGTIDQFYTGGSDGVLKMWNILLSSDDVHVRDAATFDEEIMCAAFSPDKSNLLVGDAAGGIHILSAGPFSHVDDHMRFERATESSHEVDPDPESGVETANRLLSSGQLVRHPIYGVGQGPHYSGPFAAWARPQETPSDMLSVTPLSQAIQEMQLEGPPVEQRPGLDSHTQQYVNAQIQLARIRNQHNEHKREQEAPAPDNKIVIDLCSDEEGSFTRSQTLTMLKQPEQWVKQAQIEPTIIDLTGDTDSEDTDIGSKNESENLVKPGGEFEAERLQEALEEDYWFPQSGDVDANIQDSDL